MSFKELVIEDQLDKLDLIGDSIRAEVNRKTPNHKRLANLLIQQDEGIKQLTALQNL